MSADLLGWDAALDRIAMRIGSAAQAGASAELRAVVDAARASWPRDTGRSAAQLVPVSTPTGARLDLSGYAPFVRRAGSSRPAWQELITDRILPARAGDRIAEGVRRG